MHNNSTAVINNLLAAEQRGLSLPAAFTAAIEDLAERYAPPAGSSISLAEAVANCTSKGVDPFADEAVRTILLRQTSSAAVESALITAHEIALAALLQGHGDAILNGWRAEWAEQGLILSEAARKLPTVEDFERPGSVAMAGPAASSLAAWSAGHEAILRLRTIAGAAGSFVSPSRTEWRCLVGAPLTAAQHDQLIARMQQRNYWAPALIGVPLDLANGDTLIQRAEALSAERDKAFRDSQGDPARHLRFK